MVSAQESRQVRRRIMELQDQSRQFRWDLARTEVNSRLYSFFENELDAINNEIQNLEEGLGISTKDN